jgi:hypothetical protein
MRTATRISVVVLATWLGAGGCSYNPKFKDGELKCSLAGECPEGYTCQNNACSSSGGRDAAVTTDTTPKDDAGPQVLMNRYIGMWTMDTAASVLNQCDDGSLPYTNKLSPAGSPSVMTISAGTGQNDLESAWLCTLTLKLDTSGAHLNDANPTCADSSGDPKETWTATQFEFYAANARTATHTASYTRVDRYANGTTVTCAQTVTATLTKN